MSQVINGRVSRELACRIGSLVEDMECAHRLLSNDDIASARRAAEAGAELFVAKLKHNASLIEVTHSPICGAFTVQVRYKDDDVELELEFRTRLRDV